MPTKHNGEFRSETVHILLTNGLLTPPFIKLNQKIAV